MNEDYEKSRCAFGSLPGQHEANAHTTAPKWLHQIGDLVTRWNWNVMQYAREGLSQGTLGPIEITGVEVPRDDDTQGVWLTARVYIDLKGTGIATWKKTCDNPELSISNQMADARRQFYKEHDDGND